ncbi:DUF4304 domain-containing protein [Sphingobacterium olei]|uniref:DUF4304 domain-containing protein n=1 Tax=Sphingobacterium olei TaxID=2571155 RepID=A0A4V6WHN5_9SPHI|nr:DUF4304 domain-containing protein [Sphingobacterium olei]TJZ53568.1 DUF4304 domain-containing protein [Sphingobacterium olei]
MEKKNLIKLLDEMFIPLGFKRKGNNWVSNGDVLSKVLNLQKSNYSNAFYINYGYIIRELELTTTMHIFKGLGSIDSKENSKIIDLLDLENSIPMEERLSNLKTIIYNKIVTDFQTTNTEEDILNDLKKRPHLNNIPLVVKRYFNLPE